MIVIRKATNGDSESAWNLRNAAINEKCIGLYPPNVLKIWTAGNKSEIFVSDVVRCFYVATVGNHVIGTAAIDIDKRQIDAVFVHPDHMGRGVGRRLMVHMESLARAKGLKDVVLDATLNAVPFYRACGFTGEGVKTYNSPRGIVIDCISMSKFLG